jgi:hypothetical protein
MQNLYLFKIIRMKKFILSCCVLFMSVVAVAQQAFEGKTKFKKNEIAAIVCEMQGERKLTEKAIVDNLEAKYGKSKSEKDFNVFKGVKIPELGPDTYDIYVLVEKKSKKEDDKSLVYVAISMGNENFVSSAANLALMENAKKFTQSMLPWVAAADLERQIKNQEEEVKKAERKHSNSVEDGQDLEKRKAKIEKEIEENKRDQETKKSEAEKQKQILEALKSKRK